MALPAGTPFAQASVSRGAAAASPNDCRRALALSSADCLADPPGRSADAPARGAWRVLRRVALVLSALTAVQLAGAGTWSDVRAAQGAPPVRRIVSLVPALTEILFAIGAGPQVVGVSSYDDFPAAVKALPRVGALLDPDVERILSLRPDLVVVYGSQSGQQSQFERAGIRTFSYRHGGVATVLETIRDAGTATGHAAEASRVVAGIQSRLDAVRARVRGRPRPRVLLVFERQPGTLREIYASGGTGFLHDMLEIAGGQNVFADVAGESVQPSHETLLARAPEVILEVRASGLIESREVADERGIWSALPALPAVRSGRVRFLSGTHLVVPGPRLASATEDFARVLHPDAWGLASAPGSDPGDASFQGQTPYIGRLRGLIRSDSELQKMPSITVADRLPDRRDD